MTAPLPSPGSPAAARAAFADLLRAPWNLLFLAAAAGLFAAAGAAWGAAALAADLAVVAGLALTPRAQRAALARRRERVRAERRRAAAALLATLSESQRAQHAELRRLCAEVEAAWGDRRPLLRGAAEGLDDLCDTFARLLSGLNEHRRLVGDKDRRQVERDLHELEAQAAGASAELSAVLEQRRRTLRERIEVLAQAESNRQLVAHHLAALEDYVRLLRDRTVAGAPGADAGAPGVDIAPDAAVARAREALAQVERFVDAAERLGSRALVTALALAAAAALGLGGCSRCGRAPSSPEAGAPSVLDLFAPEAEAVLYAPRAGKVGRALLEMADRLGAEEPKRAREDVARQLGFDPFTEDGLRSAGLDPAGEIGWTGGAGATAFLAATASDGEKLEATLGRLAKDRLGAGEAQRSGAHRAGARRVSWARASEAPPELSLLLLRGVALVCAGAPCAQALEAAEKRPRAASFAASPRWRTARDRLGDRDLYLLARTHDAAFAGVPEVAAGLTLASPAVRLRVFAPLDTLPSARLRSALPGGGATLVGRLGKGAPLYLRAGADARVLAELVDRAMLGGTLARLREEMKASGADLDRDLLGNIQPGAAAAVDLAPTVDLSRALVLDPRRVNPFQNFTVQAVAQVKDPARMRAAMEKAVSLAPRFGTTVEARRAGGARKAPSVNDIMIYQARYALGDGLGWALDGDTLVAGGGRPGIVEELVARAPAEPAPQAFPSLSRAALFADPGAALALDLLPLAAEIRALPPEAFGTGPTAFTARSMAQNLLDPLSRLRAALHLVPAPGGALLDAELEVR